MRPLFSQMYAKSHSSVLRHVFSVDGLILLMLPPLAVFLSYCFSPNFFCSILLFLGLPAAYASVRASKYILKSAVFSALASLPLMIILEYIGGLSKSWAFPPSVFPIMLFGRVQIEVLLWSFFNIFTAVLIYEFLFDRHAKVFIWSKRMWILVRYVLVWAAVFVVLFLITHGGITVPYFYLLFGIVVFLFPIVMTWLYYPEVLPKVAYTCVYFSFLSILYEITALKLGWWYFPGTEFVGYITMVGVTFPLEELIFWVILFAPAVVCAFEYLDDDHR